MKDKHFVNISFVDMLTEVLEDVKDGRGYYTYYWYHEDKGFLEIVECDLLRGRIIMEDGDFSEFDWEIRDSSIYREAI